MLNRGTRHAEAGYLPDRSADRPWAARGRQPPTPDAAAASWTIGAPASPGGAEPQRHATRSGTEPPRPARSSLGRGPRCRVGSFPPTRSATCAAPTRAGIRWCDTAGRAVRLRGRRGVPQWAPPRRQFSWPARPLSGAASDDALMRLCARGSTTRIEHGFNRPPARTQDVLRQWLKTGPAIRPAPEGEPGAGAQGENGWAPMKEGPEACGRAQWGARPSDQFERRSAAQRRNETAADAHQRLALGGARGRWRSHRSAARSEERRTGRSKTGWPLGAGRSQARGRPPALRRPRSLRLDALVARLELSATDKLRRGSRRALPTPLLLDHQAGDLLRNWLGPLASEGPEGAPGARATRLPPGERGWPSPSPGVQVEAQGHARFPARWSSTKTRAAWNKDRELEILAVQLGLQRPRPGRTLRPVLCPPINATLLDDGAGARCWWAARALGHGDDWAASRWAEGAGPRTWGAEQIVRVQVQPAVCSRAGARSASGP